MPFFILAVLEARFGLALVIFIGAGVTDLADGLIARWFRQGTPLGSLLDPAADKLLLTAGFILLTEYPSMFQSISMAARIPLWLTILTISRDVLIVGVAVILYLAVGESRFPPTIWGKLTAGCESLTVAFFLLCNTLGRREPILDVMIWGTLLFTLLSGFHYLWRTVHGLRTGGASTASAARK